MSPLYYENRIREKIVENRKSMGYRRNDVVVRLQLSGFDVSYETYKDIELGRKRVTAVEFLFLAKLLNIDVTSVLSVTA